MKVGANSNIGVSTLLVEERKPSPVGVQEPNARSRDGLDHIHHVRIDTVDNLLSVSDMNVSTSSSSCTQGIPDDAKYVFDNTDIPNEDRAVCYHRSGIHRGCACSVASKHGIVVRYGLDDR
jgi:hypothetical protein